MGDFLYLSFSRGNFPLTHTAQQSICLSVCLLQSQDLKDEGCALCNPPVVNRPDSDSYRNAISNDLCRAQKCEDAHPKTGKKKNGFLSSQKNCGVSLMGLVCGPRSLYGVCSCAVSSSLRSPAERSLSCNHCKLERPSMVALKIQNGQNHLCVFPGSPKRALSCEWKLDWLGRDGTWRL